MKLGRNDPCHCGSGKKYKTCCLSKDEAKDREARNSAREAAASEPTKPADAPVAQRKESRRGEAQPWKGHGTTRGFQRVNAMRKVGGGG